MRVALLVILESASDSAMSRAFLPVGGASVARRQLATALALECRRVVCLTSALNAPVLELQHAAEAAGASFHVVNAVSGLSGRITAEDEVFVFSDGLLSDTEVAKQALGAGPGVLVQPIEAGLAAGFERLDLNHAAGGLIRIPGRLVDRLFDLPADCDAPSALTRIALQAGVPMRNLPRSALDSARWRLVKGEDDAHAAEDALIAAHLAKWPSLTPGLMLARWAVTVFGPSILHGGKGSLTVGVGFFAIVALALGAGWFGLTALALGLLGLGWGVLQMVELLAGIERDSLSGAEDRPVWATVPAALVDAVLVILLVWRAPMLPWETLTERAFPPLVVLGLLRLLPLVFGGRWVAWCEDRLVLCLVLAACALVGVLGPTLVVFGLLLIVAALALGHGFTGLTRT